MLRPLSLLLACLLCGCSGGSPASAEPGKELFRLHCAGCHPDGSNPLYPAKTLHRADLAANGITTAEGIVSVMRNPGRGMKRFDRKTLSDRDAAAVAAYVLQAFR